MHLIQQGIGVLRRFAWISVGCMVVAVLAAMAAHVWFAHCLAVWLLAQVAWLVGPYVFWRRHWADWPWEKRLLAVAVTAAAGMCLAAQVVSSLGWLTLEVLGAVWCGVGALAVLIDWVVPRPPSPTVAPQDDPPPAWHARLYLTVVLAMVGYYAFRAFVLAVEPVSDAPMYHLYFAARWLKAGRLDIVPIPFGESAAGYFPSNAELIYVWWMLPFHADTLAKLGQLPFALLGAVAVFGLARELGASRTAGTYAAASYLAVGPICAHSALANVDLAMACFELAAVYFLVVCCRRFTRSDWALAGLACGVFVGTKYVALTYAVLVLPLVVGALCTPTASGGRDDSPADKPGTGAILLRLVTFLICALVAGAYWYARNWVVTGNPLFPLDVHIGAWTVFPGAYDRVAMLNHIHHIPVTDVLGLVGMVINAWGGWFLVPAAWAWVWGPGRSVQTTSPHATPIGELLPGRVRFWLWCMPVAHVALYWLSIPYQNQFRFLYPATGLAMVWLAAVQGRARAWRWATVVLLWGAWLASALVSLGPFHLGLKATVWLVPLMPTRAVAIVVFGLWAIVLGIVIFARSGAARRTLGIGVCACLLAIWLGSAVVGVDGVPDASLPTSIVPVTSRQFAPAWLTLERLTDGDRVAYAGTNLPYYLFGTRLKNTVRYVAVNTHRDFLFHDYVALARSRPGYRLPDTAKRTYERDGADYAAWLTNLRAERVRWLFVTNMHPWEQRFYASDPEGYPVERTWADQHPEHFLLVYGHRDPWAKIYRVRSGP